MTLQTNDPDGLSKLGDRLLALQSAAERADLLREEGMLDADGVSRLLDVAKQSEMDDPARTIALAEICSALAVEAGAPEAAPRADYLSAASHAACGRLNTAWMLLEKAQAGYRSIGDETSAVRTNLGLMHLLCEMGRPEDALVAGQAVLTAVSDKAPSALDLPPEEAKRLAGSAHVNIGICHELTGRFDQALDAFGLAEALFVETGVEDRVAGVQMNRGVVLLGLGRGRDALGAFESAADHFGKADNRHGLAQALTNIGDAYLLLGDYAPCLAAFDEARATYDSLDMLDEAPVLLVDSADAMLALNLHNEALSAYREAERSLASAGATHHRARALWGMGATMATQCRHEEAEDALILAGSLFDASDNAPLLASVMLEHAALRDAQGDRYRARALARGALDRVRGRNWPIQQVFAHMRLSDLALPDAAEAELHLVEAQRVADRLHLPQLAFRLNQRLGHVRLLQGNDEEALELLEAAISEIERIQSTLSQEAIRVSFLSDKHAVYEDLVHIYLRRGDEASLKRAFDVTEHAKSRTLTDMFTGLVAEHIADALEPKAASKLMQLQADLNAVYNRLLGAGDPGDGKAPLAELEARAADLGKQLGAILAESGDRIDRLAPFSQPGSSSHIHLDLPEDEVLLTYHIVGDDIVAFVSSAGTLQTVRTVANSGRVAKLVNRWDAQTERLRARPDFVSRHIDRLQASSMRVLEALHDELLAPLEDVLDQAYATGQHDGARKLTIVPHRFLHSVPFHALYDGERHIVQDYEIAYAPSATVWSACRKRSRQQTGQSLVMAMGDPVNPGRLAQAQTVAQHLVGAVVHTDEAATTGALALDAGRSDVIHLACGGSCRPDNPMFSSIDLHDGRLVAGDATRLDLDGALVTFGGAESGNYSPVEGDEIMGMTNAFLGAGAASLVVSQWPASQETAGTLMGNFYERMQLGHSRAEALRAAQLSVMNSHPHPFYWAPFVLVGKRN